MHRRQHVTSRLLPALCVAALLAVVCSSAAIASQASASNVRLGGTWKGSYGGSYSGTFTIHWRQASSGALRGNITLSRPPGTYTISGKVRGSAITFGAVGAGATYTGAVSGSSMSGRYKTGDGGSGHWSAHKVS
jgi:opacity protein-like surface antigen